MQAEEVHHRPKESEPKFEEGMSFQNFHISRESKGMSRNSTKACLLKPVNTAETLNISGYHQPLRVTASTATPLFHSYPYSTEYERVYSNPVCHSASSMRLAANRL